MVVAWLMYLLCVCSSLSSLFTKIPSQYPDFRYLFRLRTIIGGKTITTADMMAKILEYIISTKDRFWTK